MFVMLRSVCTFLVSFCIAKTRSLLIVTLLGGLLGSASDAPFSPGQWVKHPANPVFEPGPSGAWDDQEVYAPSVLYNGAIYQMWYSGGQGSDPRRIGYATSPDGLTWTRGSADPVLDLGPSGSWDEATVRTASVLLDGGLYKMWYTGRNASGQCRIGYATSPDGLVWARHIENPVLEPGLSGSWDEGQLYEPFVIKDGSSYKMWYRAMSSAGVNAIGYATSPDGVAWTRLAQNPILTGTSAGWDYTVLAPFVLLEGSRYHLWYTGGNFSGSAYETGYATSPDGLQWTKLGHVLRQGSDGSFDRYGADFGSVLLNGDIFQMWYTGRDGQGVDAIGYASAPALVLTQTISLPAAYRNRQACLPSWADDFSDYHSGWFLSETNDVKYAYTEGEYQILVKAADAAFQSNPGVQMTDGVLLASMHFEGSGDDIDNGGIMFGKSLDNQANYYRFTVGRNGNYCIQRREAGVGFHDLVCAPASSYLVEPAVNRLKVVRNGAEISVYLNDQFLARVNDSAYLGSLRVGLVAGTQAGNADLRFDDFQMFTLACGQQIQ